MTQVIFSDYKLLWKKFGLSFQENYIKRVWGQSILRFWDKWNVLDTEESLLVLLLGIIVSGSGKLFWFTYYYIIFNLRERQAVLMIENCWCSYRDRHMYRILRTAISSAVSCFWCICTSYEQNIQVSSPDFVSNIKQI